MADLATARTRVDMVPEHRRPEGIGRMYLDHFGLRDRPFSLLPDPDYLYWSEPHAKTYAMLEYGLATFAPIIVITGEIGAGKTTLVRHLLRSDARNIRIGSLSSARSGGSQLLYSVLSSLGETPKRPMSYVQMFAVFEASLRRVAEAGYTTLLVFDEAQGLSESRLEEIRCLSNINCGNEELLQLLLVGQPELNTTLRKPKMLQFAQRVAARHHLSGMPPEAVGQYIDHRLATAGASRSIFAPEACALVSDASGGLPRVINQICDYSLVYAFAEGRLSVEADIVRLVIAERDLEALVPRKARP